jgi:hypothetical protein
MTMDEDFNAKKSKDMINIKVTKLTNMVLLETSSKKNAMHAEFKSSSSLSFERCGERSYSPAVKDFGIDKGLATRNTCI